MTKEQFLREAIINLENKLFETREELAELKASLPQIKHDAIMEFMKLENRPFETSGRDDQIYLRHAQAYAKNVLAKEKDKSE